MDKIALISKIRSFQTSFPEELIFKNKILDFILDNDDFYSRKNETGHITGSAWILDEKHDNVLLIHHKKINKWFQPGGHTEVNDQNIFETALREAKEETGLDFLSYNSRDIFDIDIHLIPENKGISEHLHYDIRFLFYAESMILNPDLTEVKDIEWIRIFVAQNDKIKYPSIQRMLTKSVDL